eukprot:2204241-Amphidinium_carterae.2
MANSSLPPGIDAQLCAHTCASRNRHVISKEPSKLTVAHSKGKITSLLVSLLLLSLILSACPAE